MRDSQQWGWSYVTADQLITSKPCELACAYIVPSGAVTDSYLYHGVSTQGQRIICLGSAVATIQGFNPAKPVFCPNGLYVDVGSNTTGIFVQWRHLDERGG